MPRLFPSMPGVATLRPGNRTQQERHARPVLGLRRSHRGPGLRTRAEREQLPRRLDLPLQTGTVERRLQVLRPCRTQHGDHALSAEVGGGIVGAPAGEVRAGP